ncbi:MAG: glycosyltransferase family 39 protein, partial [Anaerolineae bacterium]
MTAHRSYSPGRSALPLAALLCAAALALRLPYLGAESLWYDETVSAFLASQPIADALVHTALDIHPPGYYLLQHFWTRLAGSGEYSLAFLSLWFGVLLVALTFRVTRGVFGTGAALVAAVLSALSAYSVWYSQEVRM